MAIAWKDLTKDERATRIKAGQVAAKERRANEVVEPTIDDIVAAAVAKALAGVRTVQAEQTTSPVLADLAKKDPKSWTPEDRDLLRKEHERLQAALEAIPYKGEDAEGQRPGTIVGDGFNRDYVPFTKAWFLDVAARRTDRNLHNGRPAELTWPEYKLFDVYYQGTAPWLPITVNGVTFNLLPAISCMLPTPHYAVYMRYVQGGKINDANFQPPENPGKGNGYFHVSPKTGLAVILGKGPLDSLEAREAGDFRPESI